MNFICITLATIVLDIFVTDIPYKDTGEQNYRIKTIKNIFITC